MGTRLFLLDIINNEAKEIQIGSGIDDYYKYLQCDCFDIANRELEGRRFDIFCDDEGLLKDSPTVSAINHEHEMILVGNLIFANHDSQGNTTSLTDDDIDIIKKHVRDVEIMNRKTKERKFSKIIVGLEY